MMKIIRNDTILSKLLKNEYIKFSILTPLSSIATIYVLASWAKQFYKTMFWLICETHLNTIIRSFFNVNHYFNSYR